ncbi:MAG: isoleucine--tRNA ligase [Thermotogae bacterium]|nr:isoleucine--tRNA ligase [Thermotogota bacterium]
MAKDYKDTLNMPRTDFPMRGRLPKREPLFQRKWEEKRVFKRIKERKAPIFILHDGPPYSNGHIHLGHALNKTLKDFLIRYKALRGYRISFVLGWDNHGMPIEKAVLEDNDRLKELKKLKGEVSEELRKKIDEVLALIERTRKTMLEKGLQDLEVKRLIREASRGYAQIWVEVQKAEFKRLGVLTDWEDIYLTMDPKVEAKETEVLARFVREGYIYRGYMPLPWSRESQSALAMAEIEYYEKESPSLWFLAKSLDNGYYILVWTTTPWTLFGNRAFAFSPTMEYILFRLNDGRTVVFSAEALERIKETLGWEGEIIGRKRGKEFEGEKFQHPLFKDRISPGILADFVSAEEGSGIVHIAPGHGKEDYEVGRIYGLEVFSPVDERGNFTEEADEQTVYPLNVAGLSIEKGGERAIERLKKLGTFVKLGKMYHSYPHDWRYKKPLIFRATSQWFLSLDHKNLRQRALRAIKEDVKWHPPESINRIYASVKERPDWVLSRQRAWGVFIPAVKCENCGWETLVPEVMHRLAEDIRAGNSDAWLTEPLERYLPEGFKCGKCGSTSFTKRYDILDVWFDSGSTCITILKGRNIGYPSDVYLEGWDQHRGWFNASLMVGMAHEDRAPYRVVITHGFVLDEQGRAMSKSLGNVIPPSYVINKYGADVLRLWVASVEYTQDVRIGDEILKRIVDAYRKIRNTFRYLLSNLYDFTQSLDHENLLPMDRWALSRLYVVSQEAKKFYDSYEFNRLYRLLYNYVIELSAFYFEALKDRLYTWSPSGRGRRSAQTALYHILRELLLAFSPIIPHTTEEVWEHSPFKDEAESVALAIWENLPDIFYDEKLEEDFNILLAMRDEVYPALEMLRRERKIIGQNLDARIEFAPKNEYESLILKYEPYLQEIFGVSQFLLAEEPKGDETVEGSFGRWAVSHAKGSKCPRCWMWWENLSEGEICPKCKAALSGEDALGL